jgi:hypothetical protein
MKKPITKIPKNVEIKEKNHRNYTDRIAFNGSRKTKNIGKDRFSFFVRDMRDKRDIRDFRDMTNSEMPSPHLNF